MQKNSAVLDANIWISYFISRKIDELIYLVHRKKIILYRSNRLTSELTDVLSRPKFKGKLPLSVEEYLNIYQRITVWVNTKSEFTTCPDEKDNYLFDLAIQSKSKYLVSGDKVVLATPVKPPLQIITLADFKKIFS